MVTFYNLQVRKIRLGEADLAKSHKKLVREAFRLKPQGSLPSTSLYGFKLNINISSSFTCCGYSPSLIFFVLCFWKEKPRLWSV